MLNHSRVSTDRATSRKGRGNPFLVQMQQLVEDDPLREPTTARARLRRARQQEAAKRYEATYHLRTDGNISSVRTHPATTLKTESFTSTGPASVQPATTAAARPATTSMAAPAAPLFVASASSAAKTSAGAAAAAAATTAPVMQGRLVNVSGQTLDGKCEAVKRILQGDFYTVRGGSVGELASKPEGKHMRFRATSQPPQLDGCAGGKDAFTMTRQAKTKTLAYERRAAAATESPTNHRNNRAPSYSPTRSKDKQHQHQHHSASKRHHCHHGHRDAYWDDEHDYDDRYGVYAPQEQLKQQAERRSTKHHHHGGKDGRPVHPQHPRGDNKDAFGDDYDEDNVRYMEALDLDRLFADRRGARSAQGVHRRPGTAQGYRLPTAASANKAASQEEFQLKTQRLNSSNEPAAHPSATAASVTAVHAKVPVVRHRDAYETALKQQHAHPPGHAAVVSQGEMNKILALVEKAPSHFDGNPAGKQGAGTRVGSRRRPDSAGIIS